MISQQEEPIESNSFENNPFGSFQINLQEETVCNVCEAKHKVIAELCPNCGARKRFFRDKNLALVLNIILGLLGAHKFYMGRKVAGLIYLLCSITIVGLLITIPLCFLDALANISQSDQDFISNQNRDYLARKDSHNAKYY